MPADREDSYDLVDVGVPLGTFGRTSFDERTGVLYFDFELPIAVNGPVFIAVRNISNPAVAPREYTGLLPDGTPYYDITSFPGTTGRTTLAFINPDRSPIDFDLILFSRPNSPPRATHRRARRRWPR